jgi:hypothetical protein
VLSRSGVPSHGVSIGVHMLAWSTVIFMGFARGFFQSSEKSQIAKFVLICYLFHPLGQDGALRSTGGSAVMSWSCGTVWTIPFGREG